MRETLLLLACLLVFVASNKQDQITNNHDPISHEHGSHDEDEEGSVDSGSGLLSGSGEGKT